MTEVRERVFPEVGSFGDSCSFLNFIREQYKKPNPLIRTCLLLKLGDLEFVYDDVDNLEGR